MVGKGSENFAGNSLLLETGKDLIQEECLEVPAGFVGESGGTVL